MPRRPREQDESSVEDTNVLPVMNIMFLLIPALLLAMETASMAGVAISPPSFCVCNGDPAEPQDKPLELAVRIGSDGFRVAHAAVQLQDEAGVMPSAPSIPLARPDAPIVDYGRYDYVRLEELAHEFKARHPHETVVRVSAENDIPAQVLINTLDALRGSDCKLSHDPIPSECLFFRPIVQTH
jgi:biopolymer transport protein ExbD